MAFREIALITNNAGCLAQSKRRGSATHILASPLQAIRVQLWVALAFLMWHLGGTAQVLPPALLIGNSAYRHVQPLMNPRQDATALGVALTARGFDSRVVLDADDQTIRQELDAFYRKLRSAKRGVIYFAGHGVQIGGRSYLLPVDARTVSPLTSPDSRATSLQTIIDSIATTNPDAVAVILDACRDNPFSDQADINATRTVAGSGTVGPTASASRGLGEAGQTIPPGVLVAYGASAGQTAVDSLGAGDTSPNGLFTRHLLKQMQDDRLTLRQVLRRVRDAVLVDAKAVQHRQIPSVYDASIDTKRLFPTPTADPGQPVPVRTLKTIRMVVPGARNGQSDFVARKLEESLRSMGFATNIENVIDVQGDRVAALKYPADVESVTILMSNYGSSLRRAIAENKQFRPIGMLTETPTMLLASLTSGVVNLQSLLAINTTRSQPWRIGFSGPGSHSEACLKMLRANLGAAKVEAVATRGVGPAMVELANGKVDLFCDDAQVVESIVKTGKVKVLANLQEDALSDGEVPTAQMQGYAWVVPNWQALFVSTDAPSDTVFALSDALKRVVRDPDFQSRLKGNMARPVANDKTGPEEVDMSLRLGIAVGW